MDASFCSTKYKYRKRKRKHPVASSAKTTLQLNHIKTLQTIRKSLTPEQITHIHTLYYSPLNLDVTTKQCSGIYAVLEFIHVTTQCNTWLQQFLHQIGLSTELISTLAPVNTCHCIAELINQYKQRAYEIMETLLQHNQTASVSIYKHGSKNPHRLT